MGDAVIPLDHFRGFAQTKDGSAIVFWRPELRDDWASSTLVWLDSEGTPRAPLASSLSVFMGMAVLASSGQIYESLNAAKNPDASKIESWATRTQEIKQELEDDLADDNTIDFMNLEADEYRTMHGTLKNASMVEVDNLLQAVCDAKDKAKEFVLLQ